MTPPVPVDALARLFNLSPRRIQQLVAERVIPRPERGRYDLLRCIRAYVIYLQRRAEGLGVESTGMSDERVRLVAAQADHEELKVAELQATLLPRDGVLDAWEELRAAFRARCLQIPGKLSARLALIQDRGEVQAILTAAVREALEECSRFDLPDSPRGEPPAGSNGKSRPWRAPLPPRGPA